MDMVKHEPNTIANRDGNPNRTSDKSRRDNARSWRAAFRARTKDILLALNNNKHERPFAGFDTLPTTDFNDQLGLYVDGVGNIGVPLQEEQARSVGRPMPPGSFRKA